MPEPRLAEALADRYRVERELGQGGMATVYLAEDLMVPLNLEALIPIVALSIPLAGVVVYGLQRIAKTRLEETRLHLGADRGNDAEIATLRDEVGELRRELGEVQERLDFTERLLAQSQERKHLEP
jgi:serine/threonine protein kinase